MRNNQFDRTDSTAEQQTNTANSNHVQAQRNIDSIMKLERDAIGNRSTAEYLADKVTTSAGSTPFLILHVIWFGLWVVLNAGLIPGLKPFDPFPFSFLTLVVSLEAIFLTLLVLMSQNRMIKEADKRMHLDLQLNMLAEQESTVLLKLMQKVAKHIGVEEDADHHAAVGLAEDTDVHHLAKKLGEHLPG
ncbi:MAG: DUF1003 domain-containing protein [Acidobacteriota bacterium]